MNPSVAPGFSFRSGGDALGLCRVIEPLGMLPQAAERVDNQLPPYASEVWLDVETLNIDAASFVQLEATEKAGGPPVAQQILDIIAVRGKMQNPVTGSGGMLLGRIKALGPDYTGPLQGAPVGTRVATLVSLTLTPLHIDRIVELRPQAHQVVVQGRAHLPSSAPIAVLPNDFPDALALSILDVAGAPALVDRWAKHLPHGGSLLVIGAGKAGILSLAAARQARPDLKLFAIDYHQASVDAVLAAGLCDDGLALDASRAIDVRAAAQQWTAGQGMDAVVNMASLPGTEMATILAAKSRALCLFFGMATSFTRVALGAEGVGADVDLLIGNGYAIGHADFALDLVRSMPAVRELLVRRFAA